MSVGDIKDRIIIRHALASDMKQLRAMQERSFLALGSAYYAPEEIAAFISEIGTMDAAVLDEGHYFVAADDQGAVLASGGWSRLRPGYERWRAASAKEDAERSGRATVRSVYVDPSLARQGVGSAIMATVETDAALCGVRTLDLMATLSGVSFYRRLGYRGNAVATITLTNGMQLDCVKMTKQLGCASGSGRYRTMSEARI